MFQVSIGKESGSREKQIFLRQTSLLPPNDKFFFHNPDHARRVAAALVMAADYIDAETPVWDVSASL